MSHFTVLVVGENPDEHLEPFSEELQVPEYTTDCWCIGKKAHREATEKVEAVYKSIDQLRKEFHNKPVEDRTEENWRKDIKTYEDMEKTYAKENPMYGKPDPTCEECKGTGKVKSTYNPNSKWDWYSVGGRWAGFFMLKDRTAKGKIGRPGVFNNEPVYDADQARKGEINWEAMKGANRQRGIEAWERYKKDLEKAKTPEEKSTIFFRYDTTALTKKADFIKGHESISTFAVLKDGEWYQKGDMGWWGIVSNAQKQDDWENEWQKLIDSLPDDTLLTLVDCHI